MLPPRRTIASVSGTATLEEFRAVLSGSRDAWVRVAFTQPDEVRVFEVTLGRPPPAWREVDWTYPTARLAAFATDGSHVANWLLEGVVDAFDFRVPLAGLGSNAMTDRRQSRGDVASHEPLDWPSDEWTVSLNTLNAFAGELISTTTAPSFFSFERAAANLLGLTSVSPNWSLRGPELFVRRQDTSARISHVFVDATTVDVAIDGDRLDESILELAGDRPGESRALATSEPRIERFETPAGLPLGAWLLLRRDGGWLDRRSLSADRRLRPEAGVEYAPTDDSRSSDTPFSAEEQARIQQAAATVKTVMRAQLELEPVQLVALDAALDGMAAASSKVTRREWKLLVLGTFMDLVATQIITREAAYRIFGLLVRELHHFLALPLPLQLLG